MTGCESHVTRAAALLLVAVNSPGGSFCVARICGSGGLDEQRN